MSENANKIADQFDPIQLCDKCGSGMCFCKSTTLIDSIPLKDKPMSEKKEYPELRKELNRLVELQQQNQLTNDADKLIVELTSVLQSTPSPALQGAVKGINHCVHRRGTDDYGNCLSCHKHLGYVRKAQFGTSA